MAQGPSAAPHREGPPTRTVERVDGIGGELVLRERDGDFEIIANGTFLMDTRDGRSERALVWLGLQALPSIVPARVLIAGLGVGWSLAEARAAPGVGRIVVIEREPAVVCWNGRLTGARTGGRIDAPGVECVTADLVTWLREPVAEGFHLICLDVDNGPGWTVDPGNDWLYRDEGLAALRARLLPGGVLTVWSCARDPLFERRLRRHFDVVEYHELAVDRGPPDVVHLARPGGDHIR